MPSLATFQQNFLNDIYRGGDVSAEWLASTHGNISPHQSIKVYRNSTLGILEDALLSTFPVVTRLVGTAFMQAMIGEFIKEHPPHRGDINTYGVALPHFVDHFPPAATLPYLADVARLEWAMHAAIFAIDAPKLTSENLASLSEHEASHVKLVPHPSLSLVASPYPVEHIWLANQPDAVDNDVINLDEGPTHLAVWRPEMDVVRWAMTPTAFALLQHLVSGASFALAVHATLQHEDTTLENVQTDLATMLAHGLFTNIHLNPKGDH